MDYIELLNDDITFKISKIILINFTDIDVVKNLIDTYNSFAKIFNMSYLYNSILKDVNI